MRPHNPAVDQPASRIAKAEGYRRKLNKHLTVIQCAARCRRIVRTGCELRDYCDKFQHKRKQTAKKRDQDSSSGSGFGSGTPPPKHGTLHCVSGEFARIMVVVCPSRFAFAATAMKGLIHFIRDCREYKGKIFRYIDGDEHLLLYRRSIVAVGIISVWGFRFVGHIIVKQNIKHMYGLSTSPSSHNHRHTRTYAMKYLCAQHAYMFVICRSTAEPSSVNRLFM